MSETQQLVTEVPSSLKQLARLVVRGFYTVEDALVIDMLVRNPCMKEDDICELLRFERKQFRSRIAILRNDKFIQIRLKMETGPDGKAAKVNYYFINYKTFVNVVKFKLDIMRKRMETEERDATSRASFKCPSCTKTFTDLEADQLFDMTTGEFRCTFCGDIVQEDLSAVPKKDSRLMLARFNDQVEILYQLLHEVENIRLAPEILEPEPVDIDTIRGISRNSQRSSNEPWSGEATRNQGFAVEETRVDVTIGGSETNTNQTVRKDRPVWMTESTVVSNEPESGNNADAILDRAAKSSNSTSTAVTMTTSGGSSSKNRKDNEDIMSVLLQHEKNLNRKEAASTSIASHSRDDSEPDSSDEDKKPIVKHDVDVMDSGSEEDDAPTVLVEGKPYPIDEINDELIAQMTQLEKDTYIQVYQDHFSHMYD